MDTSKEYIKMCDCPEVQGGWVPLIGDFSYLSILGDVSINCGYNRAVGCGETWLPRQDQLQEMVELNLINRLTTFESYLIKNWYIRSNFWWKNTSMEQLWLAFVMWELHKKKWDGTGWK